MRTYFEKKIGETINHKLVTGNTFFIDVYARMYFFEILKVDDKGVTFEIKSKDIAPAGLYKGGTGNYFGEFTVNFVAGKKTKSKADILKEALKKADKEFDARYGIDKYFSANC